MRSAPRSGETTGADPILTPAQAEILRVFAASPLGRMFYFGGATALSAVYLQHRLSEDLDFFCPAEFTARRFASFETALRRRGFKHHRDRIPPVYVYRVTAPDGSVTKVDFSHYPYGRIDRATRWRGIEVDSLLDMAVNKAEALMSRSAAKDLVDLYFLLRLRPELRLERLRRYLPLKFDFHVSREALAEKLLRAEELPAWPGLLRPATPREMRKFLVDQAHRLIRGE